MPLVSRTFDQLIDFTRTSSATFVGSNGLIQSTPQSRNLLTFTQEFDNAAWTKANATVTANSTAAPDGTMTADTLTASAGTVWPQLSNGTVGTVNATVYTASYFVRPGTHTFVQLAVSSQAADWCNFTLTGNGSVQNNGSAVGTISYNSATGWYRISMVYTAGGTNRTPILTLAPSGTASRGQTGTYAGTETVFIWGAQFELGSTATDYTRNFGGLFPPRFDYDPVTLAPRGLLIEEQRTNLLLRSEEFDNASWAKTRSSITANATTSPDGTVDADKLVEDTTASNTHQVGQTFSATSGTSYSFSVYLKAAERTWAFLQFTSGMFADVTSRSAYVDLSTGAVGTTAGSPTVTVVDAGGGWRRVIMTAAATATASAGALVYLATGNNGVSYTGNGTSGIFVWGAQLEAGDFATSYIPTVASQVTRTADTALIQAPNFAPWYNQSEGTVVAEYDILGFSANQRMFSLNDNTVSNEAALYSSTGSNRLIATAAGVAVATPIGLSPITAGVVYTSALGFKLDDFGIAVNGNAAVTDNSGAMPSGIVKLNLGSNYLGSGILNGHLRSIRYYPVRLSDAQLQALTA